MIKRVNNMTIYGIVFALNSRMDKQPAACSRARQLFRKATSFARNSFFLRMVYEFTINVCIYYIIYVYTVYFCILD